MKVLTQEEFLKKAKEIHGDKYIYDKTKYVNCRTKITVICPIHGEFKCLPHNHLKYECRYCTKEKLKEKGYSKGYKIKSNKRKTPKEFVKEANEIHNGKYDYSKVVYKDNKTKVCIICPIHGEFLQEPKSHLNGCGCPKCGIEERAKKLSSTTKEFIEKAKKVHGDFYNYDDVVYIKNNEPVIINCPKHGPFKVLPLHHLNGVKCDKCKEYKLEKLVNDFFSSKKIETELHKHFKWLGKQSIDIYLPKYAVGIECQGIQHYKPIDFAGKGIEWAKKSYKANLERDKKKEILCKNNNVKLFYVKYDDNIEFKCNEIYNNL